MYGSGLTGKYPAYILLLRVEDQEINNQKERIKEPDGSARENATAPKGAFVFLGVTTRVR